MPICTELQLESQKILLQKNFFYFNDHQRNLCNPNWDEDSSPKNLAGDFRNYDEVPLKNFAKQDQEEEKMCLALPTWVKRAMSSLSPQ